MVRLNLVYTIFAICFLMAPTTAKAQDFISFGGGSFNVLHVLDASDAGDFRLEYRPDINLARNFKPWVGVEVTENGSVWGGGGILLDYQFANNFYFTPSFGVGLYAHSGGDLDLSHVIEFRSQVEVGYEFQSGHRLAVAFSHISNASLDDHNPGTEILSVYYHMPIGNMPSDDLN